MTDKTKIKTNSITKALLSCGAIACPLFIILVLIEGAIRPNYNSFLYPLSSLSIGDTGLIQISNFIFTGILLVIFSLGLKQVCNSDKEKFRGPLLIRSVGIGLIGAGIFVTDPIFGYPPDKSLVLRQFTFHGHLHDTGWTQISNFIFTGILLVIFSLGLKQVCNSDKEKFRGPLLIRSVMVRGI